MLVERKNGILQNLVTYLKNENVELKNRCVMSESKKASLKETSVVLPEICDALEIHKVKLKGDIEAVTDLNSLEIQKVKLKEDIDNLTDLNSKYMEAFNAYRDQSVFLREQNKNLKNNIVKLQEEKNALEKHIVSQKDDLKKQKGSSKDDFENQIASLKKENDVLKNQNTTLQLDLENQTACNKNCELNNEKYYIEQVHSLQPLLQEAKSINENLVYEVKALGKLVHKKDSDILILQDRNYKTEVRLSKTRKYIRHRERECQNELQHQ